MQRVGGILDRAQRGRIDQQAVESRGGERGDGFVQRRGGHHHAGVRRVVANAVGYVAPTVAREVPRLVAVQVDDAADAVEQPA